MPGAYLLQHPAAGLILKVRERTTDGVELVTGVIVAEIGEIAG
jgi:hypothetical protein